MVPIALEAALEAGGLSQSLKEVRAEVARVVGAEITGQRLVICDKAAARWLLARRAQQRLARPKRAPVRFGS